MRFAWLILLALLGCKGGASVAGTQVRHVANAPSGKHLAVYQSTTFETDAREVPEEVVVQAMRASSMFFDEDIRAFAKQISTTLPELDEDHRLVVVTNDSAIHVYVSHNELQIVAFRDGHEVSHHQSAIPSAAVKTELTPKPRREPPPRVEVAAPPPPPPPVVVEAKPVVQPPPPPKTEKKPKVVAKPKAGKKLTEPEIRAKLAELDKLLEKQLITQVEYEQKKTALLDQL